MARTIQLSELRTRVRERADMEDGTFITDSELNRYINASADWLYDLLVKAYGDEYFANQVDFSTVSGQSSYSFASDMSVTNFYKLLGVSLVPATGEEIPLKKFTFQERNKYSGAYSANRFGKTILKYRLRGNNLVLTPEPEAAQTIRVYFIPSRTIMTNDTDTLEGVNGWEEFVVIDAAIKCKDKEESDVSVLMADRQVYLARVEQMAEARDVGEPERMTDTSRYFDFDPEWGGFEV